MVENPICSELTSHYNTNFLGYMMGQNNFDYEKIERASFVKSITEIQNEDLLISSYHPKTRNSIRKFLKTSYKYNFVKTDNPNWEKSISELSMYHKYSMVEKGSTYKDINYFSSLSGKYEKDRLFIIKLENDAGDLLSMCLFFSFGDTLEYWTPIVTDLGKNVNALYGLLHITFKHMITDGFYSLNFGGTWPTQTNLARFKSRFGAKKFEYRYHNLVNRDLRSEFQIDKLISNHPYFFFWRKA